MKTITVRGLDNELVARLKSKAMQDKTSVNTVVLGVLGESLGIGKKAVRHHDLDHLAGTWSAAEAKEFIKKTADFEKADKALWK